MLVSIYDRSQAKGRRGGPAAARRAPSPLVFWPQSGEGQWIVSRRCPGNDAFWRRGTIPRFQRTCMKDSPGSGAVCFPGWQQAAKEKLDAAEEAFDSRRVPFHRVGPQLTLFELHAGLPVQCGCNKQSPTESHLRNFKRLADGRACRERPLAMTQRLGTAPKIPRYPEASEQKGI
jgi:hypothetical protein